MLGTEEKNAIIEEEMKNSYTDYLALLTAYVVKLGGRRRCGLLLSSEPVFIRKVIHFVHILMKS